MLLKFYPILLVNMWQICSSTLRTSRRLTSEHSIKQSWSSSRKLSVPPQAVLHILTRIQPFVTYCFSWNSNSVKSHASHMQVTCKSHVVT